MSGAVAGGREASSRIEEPPSAIEGVRIDGDPSSHERLPRVVPVDRGCFGLSKWFLIPAQGALAAFSLLGQFFGGRTVTGQELTAAVRDETAAVRPIDFEEEYEEHGEEEPEAWAYLSSGVRPSAQDLEDFPGLGWSAAGNAAARGGKIEDLALWDSFWKLCRGGESLIDVAGARELIARSAGLGQERAKGEILRLLEEGQSNCHFGTEARALLASHVGLPSVQTVDAPNDAKARETIALPTLPTRIRRCLRTGRDGQSGVADALRKAHRENRDYFDARGEAREVRGLRLLALLRDAAAEFWSHALGPTTYRAMAAVGEAFHDVVEQSGGMSEPHGDWRGTGLPVWLILLGGSDPNGVVMRHHDDAKGGGLSFVTRKSPGFNSQVATALAALDRYRAETGGAWTRIMDHGNPGVSVRWSAGWFGRDLAHVGGIGGECIGDLAEASLSKDAPFALLMWTRDELEAMGIPKGELPFVQMAQPFAIDGFIKNPSDPRADPERVAPLADSLDVFHAETGSRLTYDAKLLPREPWKAPVLDVTFSDASGHRVDPSLVRGRLCRTARGGEKTYLGDGKYNGVYPAWWWGFCVEMALAEMAQRQANLPTIERREIRIPTRDGRSMTLAPEQAEILLLFHLAGVLPTGRTHGFRFDGEPATITLDDGRRVVGRVNRQDIRAFGQERIDSSRSVGDWIVARPGGEDLRGNVRFTWHTKNPYGETTREQAEVPLADIRALELDPKTRKVRVVLDKSIDPEGLPKDGVYLSGCRLPWKEARQKGAPLVLRGDDLSRICGRIRVDTKDGPVSIPAKTIVEIRAETDFDLRPSMVYLAALQSRDMTGDGDVGDTVMASHSEILRLERAIETTRGQGRPAWGRTTRFGILGPRARDEDCDTVWFRGIDGYDRESFVGWIQLNRKTGAIENEGWTQDEPPYDFIYNVAAPGPIDLGKAGGYLPEIKDLALKIVANAFDEKTLETLNVTDRGKEVDWKKYVYRAKAGLARKGSKLPELRKQSPSASGGARPCAPRVRRPMGPRR